MADGGVLECGRDRGAGIPTVSYAKKYEKNTREKNTNLLRRRGVHGVPPAVNTERDTGVGNHSSNIICCSKLPSEDEAQL